MELGREQLKMVVGCAESAIAAGLVLAILDDEKNHELFLDFYVKGVAVPEKVQPAYTWFANGLRLLEALLKTGVIQKSDIGDEAVASLIGVIESMRKLNDLDARHYHNQRN